MLPAVRGRPVITLRHRLTNGCDRQSFSLLQAHTIPYRTHKCIQACSATRLSYSVTSHRYQQTPTTTHSTTCNTQSTKSQPQQKSYTKRHIFLALLGSYVLYAVYQLHDEDPEHYSWKLAVVKTLPLRLLSRIWGYVNHCELPVFMRKPLYNLWITSFGVRTEDFNVDDISVYKNLAEFFSRTINLQNRTINKVADLVAPCDSRITAFGEVDVDGTIEQIKGMNYSVTDLLGFNPLHDTSVKELDYSSQTLKDAHNTTMERKFYYIVLYLHPGDYHRFHAPTECVFNSRRHYPGQLMPVAPAFAQFCPKLFARQERVVLSGAWKHGFFSYTPIGAYNVGSMKLDFDSDLVTNRDPAWHSFYNGCNIKEYTEKHSKNNTAFRGIEVKRGDEVGYFELGSTIVLVFEVPAGHEMNWAIGKKAEKAMEISVQKNLAILEPAGIRVRVGQPLGSVDKKIRQEHIVDGVRVPAD